MSCFCYNGEIQFFFFFFRHPDKDRRPSFREVVQKLLKHEDSLLHIPPKALSSHSQAGILGAPLKAGMLMYTDTQHIHLEMPVK